MINLVLFRKNFKNHWKLLLLFCGVLALYFTVIVTMYNPDDSGKLLELMSMIPAEMASALNFNSMVDSTLTGFLISFFYGFLVFIFPMIFNIILSNSLIAKHTDRGSLACLLATPNSRLRISMTQGLFLIVTNVILFSALTAYGIFWCNVMFPGLLDVSKFILLNFYALSLQLAIASIGFFASCIFNDTRGSLAVGAGVPIGFLLIQMLRNAAPDYEFLNYMTMFSLFDGTRVLDGNVLPFAGALLCITAVLFTAGIAIFNKRDLPV